HGLGLSQWGAYSLANQGYNYQQILGHYYRNVSLAKVKVGQ
ncbi:MAG: sporulation protein, partial [Prochlorotrichaceae cyanobacterium]